MNSDLFCLINALPEDVKYNCRIKYRELSDGSLEPLEVMSCNRFIFNPDGAQLSEIARAAARREEYEFAAREVFLGEFPRETNHIKAHTSEEEKAARSKRRAKGKMLDLIYANDFDCFVTLTLDADKIDRHDYGAVIKKLNAWLDNRVRRCGLRYVGVPERHKDGAIHFHFLCNRDALRLVDSGTVKCDGRKKPIKAATADRYKIPLEQRHTVYNIPDWTLGFTTAVDVYGALGAVANYVGKYITKGSEMVGGRWYYSGGDLKHLVVKYERVSFNDVENFAYSFDCDGGSFKVWRNGAV